MTPEEKLAWIEEVCDGADTRYCRQEAEEMAFYFICRMTQARTEDDQLAVMMAYDEYFSRRNY